MCGTPFKTDQLYIEMDTCNVPGWNEIDAALVIGTHDLNTGIVLETQTITYVPEAGYTGPDEFSFYITDCLGNRFRKSNLFDVEITVEERKPFQTIKAGEGSRYVFNGIPHSEISSVMLPLITIQRDGTNGFADRTLLRNRKSFVIIAVPSAEELGQD